VELGCLILYHPTITGLTKCKMLRAMFHEYDFEIHVVEKHTVVFYVWNIHRQEIWQAAATFESTNIACGYGFGKRKKGAWKEAAQVLEKWQNEKVFTFLLTRGDK